MALLVQRDLLVNFQEETLLNLDLIHLIHPLPPELFRQLFEEKALEKPNQNVFINLTYYLICIISPEHCNILPWPVYDSKLERQYKAELAKFIINYYSTGLMSVILPSYFVNPGCFKVIKFIFQLSEMAVQAILQNKITHSSHKPTFEHFYNQIKSGYHEEILEHINKTIFLIKQTNKMCRFIEYKNKMNEIFILFKEQIYENEKCAIESYDIIEQFVDECLKDESLNPELKLQIELISDINNPVPILEQCLTAVDQQITILEMKWDLKMKRFLTLTDQCKEKMELLVARHTGEADKNSYFVEYNSEKERLCTKKLESVVTSHQRYILRNIIQDQTLVFPNLIRGFVVAISYIFKGVQFGDEEDQITNLLNNAFINQNEVLLSFKDLMNQMLEADNKIKASTMNELSNFNIKDKNNIMFLIPPIPDITINFESTQPDHNIDSYTPLNIIRNTFNLRRKSSLHKFIKQQPKSLSLITPNHSVSKVNLIKSVASSKHSTSDRFKMENISVISQRPNLINQTLVGCSSEFTKQQILRLMSTKKSCTKKKFKYQEDMNDNSLFNYSNDISGLNKSYSISKMHENTEKKSHKRLDKLLTTMQEFSPNPEQKSPLQVSGIVALDTTSSTPQSNGISEKVLCNYDVQNTCEIVISSSETDTLMKDNLLNFRLINLESNTVTPNTQEKDDSSVTPKLTVPPIKKTSSIEKIINRYKKVRATVKSVPKEVYSDENMDFRTILEENDNNPIKLPDLINSGCNKLSTDPIELKTQLNLDFSDNDTPIKSRESLGRALGVDSTFLDQFDLID